MKKKNIWLLIGILILTLALLFAYLEFDRMRTDQNPPVIEMDSPEITVSISAPESELLRGVTAADDVDGDVTGTMLVESVYGITEDHCVTASIVAFDRVGNVTKAQRQVQYTDYSSPRFTLNCSLTFEFGSVFDVMDAVGAQDVIEGDISRLVKATMLSSGTSVTELGTHDVQFRVTNALGDSVQLVLPVEIYPKDRYNAELTLTDYLVYLPKGGTLDKEVYLDRFILIDESISLRGTRPEELDIRVGGWLDTDTPGVYSVRYTAEYDRNGQIYNAYAKLLVVVEEEA